MKKILLIPVLLLAVGSGLFYMYRLNSEEVPSATVDSGPYKTYENTITGLAFKYPTDWNFQVGEEDPITHGDVMKDGEIHNSYHASIYHPNWNNGSSTYIGIFHSPLADQKGKPFDNLSIEEQKNSIMCFSEGVDARCKVLRSKNGVEYSRFEGCDDRECAVSVTIPTGKYIMTIDLVGMFPIDKDAPEYRIFNELVDTIELR